jgi:hypothetical protein
MIRLTDTYKPTSIEPGVMWINAKEKNAYDQILSDLDIAPEHFKHRKLLVSHATFRDDGLALTGTSYHLWFIPINPEPKGFEYFIYGLRHSYASEWFENTYHEFTIDLEYMKGITLMTKEKIRAFTKEPWKAMTSSIIDMLWTQEMRGEQL